MSYQSLNDYLSPQNLFLIILIIVAAWAAVELALTLRKARKAVEEISRNANETIEQVQPIIAKLDGAMDDLQPTLKEIQPLVEKVQLTVDEANVSLTKVNGILGDVSEVSETASSVSSSVKSAADAAASGMAGFVGRIATGARRSHPAAIAAPERERPASASVADDAHAPDADHAAGVGVGYVTYAAGKVIAEDAPKVSQEPHVGASDKEGDVACARKHRPDGDHQRHGHHHRSPRSQGASSLDLSDLDEPALGGDE